MNPYVLALIVRSNSPASAAEDIRSIRGPVEIPSGWAWFGWILGALALMALAYLIWRRRHNVPAPEKPQVIIPPHVRARQKLQEALALIGQPRPFTILVADTVRVYLEERFDFHAPERTTEEFLAELQSTTRLTHDQKLSLEDFLRRCDLVKFARYEPCLPELHDLHDAAVRLVEETQPPPPSLSEDKPEPDRLTAAAP